MRAIFFDFGGTLDGRRHWLDRFLDHYERAGLQMSRAALDPAFDAATRIAYGSTEYLRRCGLRDLVRFLVETQLSVLRESRATALTGIFSRLPADRVRREVADRITETFVAEMELELARSRAVLHDLSKQYALAVVSNFYGNLQRILSDADFDGVIQAIADSGQLRVYKPDPAIYHAALAMLDVEPRQAAMVGDSVAKDCVPAHQLGLTTVWLRHEAIATPPNTSHYIDFTITALEELKQIRWDDLRRAQ
jgi:putative hydrolase of the HAD superfamily